MSWSLSFSCGSPALSLLLPHVGLILAWAIGYYQWSVVFIAIMVAVIVLIWSDQSKKIVLETEQAVEVKLRRKKTLQLSETAEWVNLALNRW